MCKRNDFKTRYFALILPERIPPLFFTLIYIGRVIYLKLFGLKNDRLMDQLRSGSVSRIILVYKSYMCACTYFMKFATHPFIFIKFKVIKRKYLKKQGDVENNNPRLKHFYNSYIWIWGIKIVNTNVVISSKWR